MSEFHYPSKQVRQNYLKALENRYPERIPCSVDFSPVAWKRHRKNLEDILVRHPMIFGSHKKGFMDFDVMPPCYRKGEYFTDNWGCVWYNIQEGLEDQVAKHPLEDWKALDTYEPPDFLTETERGERNWEKTKETLKKDGEGIF